MRRNHPAYLDLIESWRRTPLKRAPYIHKDDIVLLSDAANPKIMCVYQSYNKYVRRKDFDVKKDGKLHLGLLPAPYFGNLAEATVFILMLNPGLSNPNLAYYIQQHDKEVLQNLLAGIRQDGINKKYPFGGLNPSLMLLSNYWASKLDYVVRRAKEKRRINYRQALAFVAQRVAVLQLYPYRSAHFGLPRRITNGLRSSELIRKFVKECLLPEARAGKVLIIVARGAKEWDLKKQSNVIVYEGTKSRAAHLSKKSQGGISIAKHLDLL